MDGWKYKVIPLLILLLVSHVSTVPIPTVTPDHYTVKENYITDTTSTPKVVSSTPIAELIQLQTDAIKKILSTSLQTQNVETSKPTNKCEDIETGIKESIRKSTIQEDIIIKNIQNIQKDENTEIVTDIPQRGDTETVETDKNFIPNARTLFASHRSDENGVGAIIPDNQNIILVPCVKRITQNGTKLQLEEVNVSENQGIQHYKGENEKLVHDIDSNPKYVLEKVYSPSGYLLYYMYRPRNNSPDQLQTPPAVESTSPPPSTTSTTVAPPPPPPPSDMYQERLKFVIQVPYAAPDQVVPQGYRFDQYAYYPQELQPAYVNAPVPYTPQFHMIRTLIIPNEYQNQNGPREEYVVNGQQHYPNTF